MDIHVEKTGPCKAKVSITIPPERIREEMDKTFKQTAAAVTFPGFRKGRAPRKLVLKRFGDLIKEEVKEKLVGEAVGQAVKEHGLEPVEDPELDLEALEIKEEEPLEIAFEVEVKPEFELGAYKGIRVSLEPIKVTDAEIDEAVEELRSRFAFLKTVEEGTVGKKHYLTADLTYRVEGEEPVQREKVQAGMGQGILDGMELAEEMKELLGKAVGDRVTLSVSALPENFYPEHLRGKPARVEVTIREIREVALPEVDEAFLQKIGMKSLEELRDHLYERIMENKKEKRTEEIDRKIMDRLIEDHPFEIPEKLLMNQIVNQENNLRYELIRLGLSPEQIAREAGKLDERNREAAERNLRMRFLLEKIGEREKIFVTENELEAEIREIARQRGRSPAELRSEFEERGLLDGLRSLLRNRKIRSFLREHAEIDENAAEGGEELSGSSGGGAAEREGTPPQREEGASSAEE